MNNKNLNKSQLLNNLLNHDLKLINYFQTDLTKSKILLITLKNYYQNENQTIEKIISLLPANISSRAHQLNCITDATAKGYLIKETSKSDLSLLTAVLPRPITKNCFFKALSTRAYS